MLFYKNTIISIMLSSIVLFSYIKEHQDDLAALIEQAHLETEQIVDEEIPKADSPGEEIAERKETTELGTSEPVEEPVPAIRYMLTADERDAIERMVASEGGYCPYEFQALVAECILNGCEAEDMRPTELFSRGDFWITHPLEPTEITKQAVSDVFDKGIMPTPEKIRYYYNPEYCSSPEHESFCYVLTNCNCRFFRDWED